jgi:transcriptional regulator with XRE-family HTH domain
MPRAIPVADPTDVYIGHRLRAERLARKMSQTQLGQALAVTFQQVQKYERGDNRVSASMLAKAAEALGLSVMEFFPPEKISATASGRVEPGALRGVGALSDHFLAMTPARRKLLTQMAREFAREPETDDTGSAARPRGRSLD